MGDDRARAVVQAFWRALEERDLEGAAARLDEDVVEDWPQSGERIVGRANWMAMATRHPTFPTVRHRFTEGASELWVSHAHYDYPGEGGPFPYEVCAIQRVRGGRIERLTEYFAAPFEPAEWRADIVERID